MSYLKEYICARVRQDADGSLLVDRGTVATNENYWKAARLSTDQPGSMVAVWLADSLVIPDGWSDGSLRTEEALRYIEKSLPLLLLLRAEWDEFFQVPKGCEDLVQTEKSNPEEGR